MREMFPESLYAAKLAAEKLAAEASAVSCSLREILKMNLFVDCGSSSEGYLFLCLYNDKYASLPGVSAFQ